MALGIEAVQPNNIFKVNAVQMFGNQRQQGAVQDNLNRSLFANQNNESYNLNHPLVKGSQTQARHLDLLA